jgi:carboxymethylenebutenolidase
VSVDAHTVEVATADGPMPMYDVEPEGDARGAVIVIQEAFGVNPHIEDVTRRFAAAGYRAVAPHIFHRSGGGNLEYDGDMAPIMEHFKALSDDKFLMDVDATLDHLRAAGWRDDQIGIVGFCMGGRVTFLVASCRALGAAVGFYGGGIVTTHFPQFPALVDRAPSLQTPWLGLFGSADKGIPVADVERLRDELLQAPVDTEVVLYEGADHGFHCDARAAYHPDAAADGYQRTLDWFAEHLAGG